MSFERKDLWKLVAAGLFIIPVIVVLAWFLQDFTRRVIVLPASQLIWLFDLLIDSTPQVVFWIALLVIAGILIGKSFSKPTVLGQEPPGKETRSIKRSRVAFWFFQLSHHDKYFQGRLIDDVDRLAVDILTYSYRLPVWQIEKRLEIGEIDVPIELNTFLQERKQNQSINQSASLGWLRNIWFRIRIFFRREPINATYASNNPDLEAILDYLEKELEIHYDHTHL